MVEPNYVDIDLPRPFSSPTRLQVEVKPGT
jgi:hypothetical protein